MILSFRHLAVSVMTAALLLVTSCGDGGPAAPAVTGQVEEAIATPPPAGAQQELTPLAETPTVTASQVVTLEDKPSTSPNTSATAESQGQSGVDEVEVTLDLGSDPSRPGPEEAAQTPAQPAFESADGELSTVEVVKLLAPSVVQIANESVAVGAFNLPFPVEGVGTGVIIDAAGHVLTSSHLVERVQTITVVLDTGERYEARVVGVDPTTDTSVIAIEAEGLRPAKLGVSSDLEVGEDVISIGHALGLRGGPSVSKGVVSALGRSMQHGSHTLVDLIQTDASINPGNSGGPLVNMRGEVVGINAAIIPGSQGIGFAINVDDAQIVAAQLMANGRVERGFLGITPFSLTPALADRLGVPVEEGIVVAGLVGGSGADSADLMIEDVIVKLSGEPIANTGELSRFLLAHPPGSMVEVEYYRRDAAGTATITLGTSPG